jgi:hypothetical protein
MASINFNNYIKAGTPTGDLIVDSADQFTYTNVSRADTIRFYLDYGAGYFTDAIPLKFEHEGTASNRGLGILFLLADVQKSEAGMQGSDAHIYIQDNTIVNNVTAYGCLNRLASGATDGRDDGANLAFKNRAVTYVRSGKTVLVTVYTDDTMTSEEYTLTFTAVNVIPDFRYHFAFNVRDTGGSLSVSGIVKKYTQGAPIAGNTPPHLFQRAVGL